MRPAANTPTASAANAAKGLPQAVGLGLRHEHAGFWLAGEPGADLPVGFAEIHAENYMMAGGPDLQVLELVAERHPVSVHGVALSLGGSERPDADHLAALKRLLTRIPAACFSEHLAWSSAGGIYFNDLLPLAYTSASFDRVARNIDEAQAALGTRLLLENPSHYLQFAASDWDEIDFLRELARRTGCGLLLDINNVVVSAANLGFDARHYIDRFPLELVGEIHIAGHDPVEDADGRTLLIDAHGSPVASKVWDLLELVLQRAGPKPVLIERDNAIPPIAELQPDILRAHALLAGAAHKEHRHAHAA